MKQQDRYNKANYRLQTLNHEINTQRHDQSTLQSKEMELLVREELLLGKVSHMPTEQGQTELCPEENTCKTLPDYLIFAKH